MKERHFNEIKGVVLLAVGIIVLASFLSFDPNDLSFYTSSPNIPPKNLIRGFGAYLAGFLLLLFGWSAHIIPLFILWAGINLFRQRTVDLRFPQLIAFLILLISASSLLSMFGPAAKEAVRFSGGGIFGFLLSNFLVARFGILGSFIIFLTFTALSFTLLTQILECGGIPKNLGIVKDRPLQLEKKIRQGLDCDLILTSGGVSVGDYDLVKDIVAKMGTNIKFWKVAMRPGKPLVFGMLSAKGGFASGGKGIPVFGLPGNPVSSMVSFEIFVRPAVLKMLGQKNNDGRKEVEAAAEEDIRKKPGLRYFLRANTGWRQGMYFTKTTGPQGSGILKSMALANSLIILPEDAEFIKKGEKVNVRFLD